MPCYRQRMALMPVGFAAAIPDTLPALCRRFNVARLDLFGSAADGRFDPTSSDLDFLVEFYEMPSTVYADTYFGLRNALAGLFGREVDLVTAPALKNPFLRRQIEAQRRRLFPLA